MSLLNEAAICYGFMRMKQIKRAFSFCIALYDKNLSFDWWAHHIYMTSFLAHLKYLGCNPVLLIYLKAVTKPVDDAAEVNTVNKT